MAEASEGAAQSVRAERALCRRVRPASAIDVVRSDNTSVPAAAIAKRTVEPSMDELIGRARVTIPQRQRKIQS